MDLSQEAWTSKQASSSDIIIIDVRTSEEYEAGHLVNAHLLDIRDPQ